MERPNKGLSLISVFAGMIRTTAGATASMMAFRDALSGQGGGLSRGNRIGPGRRSILTMHSKIRANTEHMTDGADRMRAVVARRAANWGP